MESYILALVARMTQERKQMNRRWLWLGVAILLIVVFFSVRSLTRERVTVRAAQAAHVPVASTVSTNGRVEPIANYEEFSPLATTVKAVYVQPGDHVPAGKLLIVLDDREAKARVASAESGLKAAQAAVEAIAHNGTLQERQASAADIAREKLEVQQAHRNLQALTKLNASGAASTGELLAARQQVEMAEASLHASEQSARNRYSSAEVERARAALADAQANLAAAREVLAETLVRAPIAGTVYAVYVSPTDFAEAGKLLLQMADLHQERIRAYFDEPEIGRLAVGQEIQIKWDAKPGRVWKGHIERIPATVVTYGTRNVGEVLVHIDDSDSGLLPDTHVTVTVTTSSEENALSVPREALHAENGKPFVFRIINGSLHRTYVTTGTINLTQVAILSGLKPGEWVAVGTTSGQPMLDDMAVKVAR